MPDVKLPPGVFTRKDRPGYWTRDRRNRGDRWVMLGHDLCREASREVCDG